MKARTKPTKIVEKQVLVSSQRRCCLCYYVNGNREARRGQLAHLNRNRSESTADDLVWLCLDHHDEFDSRTSQSKNFTPDEVHHYRDRLYRELHSGGLGPQPKVDDRMPRRVRDILPDSLVAVLDSAEGAFDYFFEPWHPIVFGDERVSLLFAYKSPNRRDGVCRIARIPLKDERVVVICEHVPGNPGISITNGVEEIAFQVCGWYGIDPARLIWIEHYPRETDWLRVTFTAQPPAGMFAGPKWTPMERQDWSALGLRPRGRH